MSFTDEEVANYLRYIKTPETEQGIAIWKALTEWAVQQRDVKGPIDLIGWEGQINGRSVKIHFSEKDAGANLFGKAAFNQIWIKEGKIMAASWGSTIEGAVKSKINFMEGVMGQRAI